MFTFELFAFPGIIIIIHNFNHTLLAQSACQLAQSAQIQIQIPP